MILAEIEDKVPQKLHKTRSLIKEVKMHKILLEASLKTERELYQKLHHIDKYILEIEEALGDKESLESVNNEIIQITHNLKEKGEQKEKFKKI